MIELPPLLRRKCLWWNILSMPVILEVIWTIQVNFFLFSSENKTFHFSMFGTSEQSLTKLFCGVDSEDIYGFESLSLVIELHPLSIRTLIWFDDQLVSCQTTCWILLNADKIFWTKNLKFSFRTTQGLKKLATAVLLHPISPVMAHWVLQLDNSATFKLSTF